ncbi:effector-associated domain EAD1-containing protein [Actinoplanes sp. CA-142083]|uniref:effector-associated domain EAD1-containing protein n=1 Tax=Actinoplanes sp. CA-142083 TaxID=3239903 RepID=UPI003D924A01
MDDGRALTATDITRGTRSATGGDQVATGFSDRELRELSRIFPLTRATPLILARLGFDRAMLPNIQSVEHAYEYWLLINEKIDAGEVPQGRDLVLRAARERAPYNDVLFGDEPPDVWDVLFLGSSPAGLDPLRFDTEYRKLLDAGAHLRADYRPIATVRDLSELRDGKYHLLHLACHARGDDLFFTDRDGASVVVRADDLVELIRPARLLGIMLNACTSVPAAEILRTTASVTIAHEDELADDDAALWASYLYDALGRSRDLGEAADRARRELVAEHGGKRSMAEGVVVLRGRP